MVKQVQSSLEVALAQVPIAMRRARIAGAAAVVVVAGAFLLAGAPGVAVAVGTLAAGSLVRALTRRWWLRR